MNPLQHVPSDEWKIIQKALPPGWEDQARSTGAFKRARYLKTPGDLLRVLLLHAVTDVGMRGTVAQARASGIASMSDVALLKRLRSSRIWLRWIAEELSRPMRSQDLSRSGMRVRAIDSTAVSGPSSKGTDWRLHYTFDLTSMTCDWHQLTDAHGAECLDRAPVARGDVLIGDRGYLNAGGIRHVVQKGGHLVVRMRWVHPEMTDVDGKPFQALRWLKRLRVGQVGEVPIQLVGETGSAPLMGRIVAVKLPAPLAQKARKRIQAINRRKRRKTNPKTLIAAQYIFLFTTIPQELLSAKAILDLYRFRWQIELAFKRLKQILKLGRLPHNDPLAAESLILLKLIVALLLEVFYRNAAHFSPWGYTVSSPEEETAA